MSEPVTADDLKSVWAAIAALFGFFLLLIIGIHQEIDRIKRYLKRP